MINDARFEQLSLFDSPQIDAKEVAIKNSLTDEQQLVLKTILEADSAKLPTRARKALINLIERKSNSFSEFAQRLLDNLIQIDKENKIGAKSITALFQFLQNFKKKVAQIARQEEIPEELQRECSEHTLISRFGMLPHDAVRVAQKHANAYIQPPIFWLIQLYINQDAANNLLWENNIAHYPNQNIKILTETATLLNVSSERVRQKRANELNELCLKLEDWGRTSPQWRSRYGELLSLEGTALEDALFQLEEVRFTANFIKKMISAIEPSYTLLCDPFNNFFKTDEEQVHLVKREWLSKFRFEECLNHIKIAFKEPRRNPERRNAYDFHLNYYEGEVEKELRHEIYTLLSKILTTNFGIKIEENYMILPPNIAKNIPELVEDILRQEDRVMSLDELYNEFERLHPGMTKNKNALRGSIHISSQIQPISRSGRYTLKEWTDCERKGGSIRELAKQFLSTCTTPQSIETVTDYINSFGRNVIAGSVYSNLHLDESRTFQFYRFQKKMHVGLSQKNYSNEYIPRAPKKVPPLKPLSTTDKEQNSSEK